LGPKVFDETTWAEFPDADNLTAASAELILPNDAIPLNELVNRAYGRSETAGMAIAALKDPIVRKWPKSIRHEIGFAISDCRIYDNRIYYRNRLFVPADDEFKVQIVYRTYSSGPAGHPGRMKTTKLIGKSYFWPRMTQDIQAFVKACEFCSRTKASRLAPSGYLHLLLVPFQAWQDILVNYVTPLPICEKNDKKYNHIAVVIYRLTKMRHFIPTKGLTAAELANAFVKRVYSFYDAPETIISDRGTQFISKFWTKLFSRFSIVLKHLFAYHSKINGQTKRINAIFE
jgi:hypothetical protein